MWNNAEAWKIAEWLLRTSRNVVKVSSLRTRMLAHKLLRERRGLDVSFISSDFAVQEGYTTPGDIAAATDLSEGDVSRSLTKLEGRGLIEPGVVAR